MRTGSMFTRFAVLASFVLAGACSGITPAMAQDDLEFEPDQYETKLLGEDIRITGESFRILDVEWQNYPEGENEQITIDGSVDDVHATLGITYIDDPDTPDVTLDLWVSGLSESFDEVEIIDSGLDGDVYWYFVEAKLDDEAFDFYLQVTEDIDGNVDLLESVFTLDGHLPDVVEEAQTDIEIGQGDFLDDVDLEDLTGLTEGEPFREDDPGEDQDEEEDAGSGG